MLQVGLLSTCSTQNKGSWDSARLIFLPRAMRTGSFWFCFAAGTLLHFVEAQKAQCIHTTINVIACPKILMSRPVIMSAGQHKAGRHRDLLLWLCFGYFLFVFLLFHFFLLSTTVGLRGQDERQRTGTQQNRCSEPKPPLYLFVTTFVAENYPQRVQFYECKPNTQPIQINYYTQITALPLKKKITDVVTLNTP